MLKIKKRLNAVEEKMDKLLVYVPKLYMLLTRAKPAYPCEQYRREICAKCSDTFCVHHPDTTVKITAKEIMQDFIDMVDSQK